MLSKGTIDPIDYWEGSRILRMWSYPVFMRNNFADCTSHAIASPVCDWQIARVSCCSSIEHPFWLEDFELARLHCLPSLQHLIAESQIETQNEFSCSTSEYPYVDVLSSSHLKRPALSWVKIIHGERPLDIGRQQSGCAVAPCFCISNLQNPLSSLQCEIHTCQGLPAGFWTPCELLVGALCPTRRVGLSSLIAKSLIWLFTLPSIQILKRGKNRP